MSNLQNCRSQFRSYDRSGSSCHVVQAIHRSGTKDRAGTIWDHIDPELHSSGPIAITVPDLYIQIRIYMVKTAIQVRIYDVDNFLFRRRIRRRNFLSTKFQQNIFGSICLVPELHAYDPDLDGFLNHVDLDLHDWTFMQVWIIWLDFHVDLDLLNLYLCRSGST